MEFHEEIAKIFKEAREKAGMTQSELAKKAKVDDNYYARVERGEVKASGEILNKIIKALEIKVKLPLES